MGRGGSQSTPRDEPRRMSPSSPPPGEEVRGRGRAECHASAGGKTGICYGFSRKWPGGKIFHPCKRNRNKLMWQLGRSPAGETPQFFFWGGVSRFFLRFPAPRHFLKTVEKTGSSGTPPPSRAGGLHAGAYIFSSFFAILCALCLQNLSSIYGG